MIQFACIEYTFVYIVCVLGDIPFIDADLYLLKYNHIPEMCKNESLLLKIGS